MQSPNPITWQSQEARRGRARRVAIKCAFYEFNGIPYNWTVLGDLYRPKQKSPIATLRRWLNQSEALRMINKELLAMLEEAGLTKSSYLSKLSQAYDDMTTDAGRVEWLKMVGRLHAVSIDPIKQSQAHVIQEHRRETYQGPVSLLAERSHSTDNSETPPAVDTSPA